MEGVGYFRDCNGEDGGVEGDDEDHDVEGEEGHVEGEGLFGVRLGLVGGRAIAVAGFAVGEQRYVGIHGMCGGVVVIVVDAGVLLCMEKVMRKDRC